MPTKPLEPILYRELSKVEAKETIDKHSALLTELVNYGTTVLARCADSVSGEENEDVAPFAIYSHMVEMTDGIEVLISQCCPLPAIPLIRSSFEGLLSLEYIFERDRVRRSLSWLASYLRARTSMGNLLDPTTTRGQQFKKTVENDDLARLLTLPDPKLAASEVSNFQEIICREQFDQVNKEFDALKSRRRRNPPWYGLFGGPSSLQQLSEAMGRGAQYEVLYRQWSSVAHGQDFRAFRKDPRGETTFNRLRDPGRLGDTTTFASNFMLAATRTMLKGFRPGEDISIWYKAEVRNLNREISSGSLNRPDRG